MDLFDMHKTGISKMTNKDLITYADYMAPERKKNYFDIKENDPHSDDVRIIKQILKEMKKRKIVREKNE